MSCGLSLLLGVVLGGFGVCRTDLVDGARSLLRGLSSFVGDLFERDGVTGDLGRRIVADLSS